MAGTDHVKRTLREAIAHLGAGRLAEAETLCEKALAADESNADAHHLRGVLALRRKRHDEAARHVARAIALNPKKAEFHNSLGAAFAEAKQHARAVHHFWRALSLEPRYVDAMRNLSRSLGEIGYEAESLQVSRELAALDPEAIKDPKMLYEVGRGMMDAGEPGRAAECFRRAIAMRGDLLRARVWLVQALEHDGRVDEAIAAARDLLAVKPDERETLKNLAVMLLQTGRRDEAAEHLRKALEISPDYAEAHLTLSGCKRYAAGDPEIERMEAACARPSTSEADRAMLHFALGKAYRDLKDYDRAFGHYLGGNALKRKEVEYDPANTAGRIGALIEVFSPERFAEIGDRFAVDSELPIFIVGMPRSGTTLIEQVLASHEAVHGAGELPWARDLMHRLPSLARPAGPFPNCVANLPPSVARGLARDHVERLSRLAPQAERITDKMPWNIHLLGLIAMMWPKAKVIHCRRDPMDTCLSCFFQYFVTGQPFAWDLVELGHYYRQYERLAEHWRKVLPIGVYEVSYEQLIAEQERISREMVAFCGLDWDDRCLEPHKTSRRVKTNLVEIRRPVNRSAIGRWHRFEAHLEPLRKAISGEIDPTQQAEQ